METIFQFWLTRDSQPLAALVPANIFSGVSERGEWIDGLHVLMKALFDSGSISAFKDLLSLPTGRLAR